MTTALTPEQEALLERVLASYRVYYDINRETPAAPFAAEAVFNHHREQYMFSRSIKLSEETSGEYAFFAVTGDLTEELFEKLDRTAWEPGLPRVKPGPSHKNTDVTLIILADHVSDALWPRVKKASHSKGYRLGLHGFSNYRVAVYDRTAGAAGANRLGQDLVNLFKKG